MNHETPTSGLLTHHIQVVTEQYKRIKVILQKAIDTSIYIYTEYVCDKCPFSRCYHIIKRPTNTTICTVPLRGMRANLFKQACCPFDCTIIIYGIVRRLEKFFGFSVLYIVYVRSFAYHSLSSNVDWTLTNTITTFKWILYTYKLGPFGYFIRIFPSVCIVSMTQE